MEVTVPGLYKTRGGKIARVEVVRLSTEEGAIAPFLVQGSIEGIVHQPQGWTMQGKWYADNMAHDNDIIELLSYTMPAAKLEAPCGGKTSDDEIPDPPRTLRDDFAIESMRGAAMPTEDQAISLMRASSELGMSIPDVVACTAYKIADALMKRRKL